MDGQRGADGNRRRAEWTWPRLLVVGVLLGWSAGRTILGRFAQAVEVCGRLMGLGRRSYQGFFKQLGSAGRRFEQAVLAGLRQQVRRAGGAHWHVGGWVPLAVDGSRFDLPRTRANERACGRAGRQRTGPQLWVTLLTHLPSGQLWQWRIGPGTGDERGDLRQMLDALPAGSLIVADAGFVGYPLLAELTARQQPFLVRLASNVSLRRLSRMGPDEREALLWPDRARAAGQPALGLRLIRFKSAGQQVVLATNVLDSRRLPRRMAGQLYRMRWGIELTYRHLKQTLERRKLCCREPANAALELSLNLLALAVLTVVALRFGPPPDRLSVAGALGAVRRATEALAWAVVWDGFAGALRSAVRDDYRRAGPKTSHRWPRKKTHSPPRPPKLTPFTTTDFKALLTAGLLICQTG